MTIETALKWSRLWWLLSLDLTLRFRDELWLGGISQSAFDYIRSRLSLQADLPTYGSDPRPKIFDKLKSFEDIFGREQFEHLLWWKRCVFSHGGDDRASEFLWSMAIHSRLSVPANPNVLTAFQLVKDECLLQDRRMNDKLRNLELSAWDSAAIDGEGSSLDEVIDSIEVIASANTFAHAWHSKITVNGFGFLDEIFAIISHVPLSADLQFDPETIPFPSSWEFDLRLRRDAFK